MIAIVDYGMGNVASVQSAFEQLGYEVLITDHPKQLEKASHIILPGVGSFQAAMNEIESRGLTSVLQALSIKKPFLGICLGMQLLFSEGFEGGETKGLNLIPGKVRRIETPYILPHIGWNQLTITPNQPEFQKYNGQYVYFVHTFAAQTEENYIVAQADYGSQVTAIVKKGSIYGIQFHPEKSGAVGLNILKSFLKEVAK